MMKTCHRSCQKNVCKKLDWQGTLVSNSGRTSIALVLLGSVCSSTQDSELMALYSLVAQKSCVCSLQRCLLDSAAAQPSQLQNIIWKCKFENWLKLEIFLQTVGSSDEAEHMTACLQLLLVPVGNGWVASFGGRVPYLHNEKMQLDVLNLKVAFIRTGASRL